jgi:hypothetical protein
MLPDTAQEELTKAKNQRENMIKAAQEVKQMALDSGKDVVRYTEHDHVYSNADKEYESAVQSANEDFLENMTKVETDYIVEIKVDFPSNGSVKLKVKKQY